MPTRPGGFSDGDFQRAFQLFGGWTSPEEVERAIQEFAVLRSPIFHAYLRNWFHSLDKNTRETQKDRYYGFFTHLHYVYYGGIGHEPKRDVPRTSLYVPQFYQSLVDALIGHSIERDGPTYYPHQLPEFRQNLKDSGVDDFQIELYEEIPGTRWNITVIQCPQCYGIQLEVRAHWIDFTVNPDLIPIVASKQLNGTQCDSCGNRVVYPIRTLFSEEPAPEDPLAFLTSVYNLGPSHFAYSPPPGTDRDSSMDRVLEIRLSQLMSSLHLEKKESDETNEATFTSFRVIYSPDEITDNIEREAKEEAPNKIPLAMKVAIEEITRKIKSGELPYSDAIEGVDKMAKAAGSSWPLAMATQGPETGDSILFLISCLLVEGLAKYQDLPLPMRAGLAAQTCQAFVHLDEPTIAQTALQRAENLFSEIDDTEPLKSLVRGVIDNALGELANKNGNRRLASEKFAEAQKTFEEKGSVISRLVKLKIDANALPNLPQSMPFEERLVAYEACIEGLTQMLEDIKDNDPDQMRVAVVHCLSGTLSNLGRDWNTLGQFLERFEENVRAGTEEGLTEFIHWLVMNPEMVGIADGLTEPATAESSWTSDFCKNKAEELYRRALELSTEIEASGFIAIQSYNLASLLTDTGNAEEVNSLFEKSLSSAFVSGDRLRVSHASLALATRKTQAGQGKEALALLQSGVRQYIRAMISGFATPQNFGRIWANAILETVEVGGDPIEAITMVENLKGVATAIAIERNPSYLLEGQGDAHTQKLSDLIQFREDLRLQSTLYPGQSAQIVERLSVLEREIQTLREEISIRHPEFVRWHDATFSELLTSESINTLLQQNSGDTTFLGLAIGNGTFWVFGVWNGGLKVIAQPFPEGERLRNALFGDFDEELGADEELLKDLSSLLLAPLSDRLKELSPDSLLVISGFEGHPALPFAAMPFGDAFLVERVTIEFITSLGVLDALSVQSEERGNRALCIGNPLRNDVPPLPFSGKEVDTLQLQMLDVGWTVNVLKEKDATVKALREKINHADIVHFACHAGDDVTGQALGRLLLAPSPETGDSGDLTDLRILWEIRLKRGSMVNLAACQTARVENSRHGPQRGLIPALMIAGAYNVLATLWPINDLLGSIFAKGFYDRYLSGKSSPVALALSQRECIKGRFGDEMSHPRAWGAYVSFGGS